MPIVPAGRWRSWMQETSNRFANRCLPLLVANQSGWWLLNPTGFTATWDGGDSPASLDVEYPADTPAAERIGKSHFGYGIVTFSFGCYFETPDGFNLLARGPANAPKDGIGPLEGIIETDWTIVPFTMSWKLTRPGSVRFEADEPFCQVVPQRRGELERFALDARNLESDAEASIQARSWGETRLMYQYGKRRMREQGDETYQREWMDDYFRGRSPLGERNEEHQTTLRLRSL